MRVAGVRVGTVGTVTLQPDNTVVVGFDADEGVVLTSGTRAAVRYLNLVGDRYMELVDGPGSTQVLPSGTEIPAERTQPALDLDLLLGGLKPVIRGLNPDDVNALTNALVQIFQGQGGALQSLLSRTSSFSNTLADNNIALESLVDNLEAVLGTLGAEGERFSGALDRFERLTSELAADRNTIGEAVSALSAGTASVTQLLSEARPRWQAPSTNFTGWPRCWRRTRTSSRCRCNAPRELPQAGEGRLLRQLRELLPVRYHRACHRS